jgi:AraC-like DNA-binding protein
MDILSQVLATMQLRGSVLALFHVSEPWGVDCESATGMVFHYIAEGRCWLTIEGREPVRMEAGQVVLLPRWPPHVLSWPQPAPRVPIRELLLSQHQPFWLPEDSAVRLVQLRAGAGEPSGELLSGVFSFDRRAAGLLLDQLPDMVLFDASTAQIGPWLMHTLRFISEETATAAPGSDVITARLTDLLLVQLLRAHLLIHPDQAPGWLRGMSDPQIGRALQSMHDDPAGAWTVASLASAAGMSRSVFASRFLAVTGYTPLSYLTRWRLQLATGYLRKDGLTVTAIGEWVGYQTPFAFSRAFRRQYGMTPGVYRQALRDAS